MKRELTIERLKTLVRYDPEMGLWAWIMPRPKCSPGKIAGTPSLDPPGYILIKIDGVQYWAHILAFFYMTGQWPTHEIDHKDRDGINNRWCNLRPSTSAQNKINSKLRSDNTSGMKGVSWSGQRQKWRARIHVNGHEKHLGFFHDLIAAGAAYDAAAVVHYGEFANLNIPMEPKQ